MTAPKPNTTNSELDEILQNLCNEVYGHGVAAKNYGVFVGGEPMKGAKARIEALIASKVEEARIDELNTLGYETAKNDWHKGRASKMWIYIADRLKTLKGENDERDYQG